MDFHHFSVQKDPYDQDSQNNGSRHSMCTHFGIPSFSECAHHVFAQEDSESPNVAEMPGTKQFTVIVIHFVSTL